MERTKIVGTKLQISHFNIKWEKVKPGEVICLLNTEFNEDVAGDNVAKYDHWVASKRPKRTVRTSDEEMRKECLKNFGPNLDTRAAVVEHNILIYQLFYFLELKNGEVFGYYLEPSESNWKKALSRTNLMQPKAISLTGVLHCEKIVFFTKTVVC